MEIILAWVLYLLSSVVDVLRSFTLADWVKIGLAILGGVYGIYQAFIHAERRIHRVLEAYFEREDQRLRAAREAIVAAIRSEHRTRPVTRPIYTNGLLSAAVRNLALGKDAKAVKCLLDIGAAAELRRKNIEKYRTLHTTQTATSHLFLGAIAAAKGTAAEALKHFEDALRIDPKDLEAMEYAGQQLLQLGHPEGAFEQFDRMRLQATHLNDQRQQMRALRHCSMALQAYPQPQWDRARRTLIDAALLARRVKDPLDAAFTFECLGRVRKKLNAWRKAKDNFAEALVRYSASEDAEAKEGAKRVRTEIEEINKLQSTQHDAEEPELSD